VHQVLEGLQQHTQVVVEVVAVINQLEVHLHLEVQELVELVFGVALL
jgi:hypothetical protein